MNKEDIVLITGGNSGMGKAVATELARLGATVVILCRNCERGEKALVDIKAESGSSEVYMMLCDLGNRESIRKFAADFKNRYKSLKILINNAGVILLARRLWEISESMTGMK